MSEAILWLHIVTDEHNLLKSTDESLEDYTKRKNECFRKLIKIIESK